MIIRNASAGDIPQIAEIEQQSFSDPWTAEGLAAELTSGVIFSCAEDSDGSCAGYLIGSVNGDYAGIDKLAVSPRRRRQGTARLLLDDFFSKAAENGCTAASLEVRESNNAARSLYLSAGFEEAGIRKRFYSFPEENAVVLIKEL